ncbi:MAG: hypothetical protein IJ131_05580 [Eggerthellaceae bacterium]|nr:hypothetical protein [Eggerthellaceae bacterium]
MDETRNICLFPLAEEDREQFITDSHHPDPNDPDISASEREGGPESEMDGMFRFQKVMDARHCK